MEAIIYITIFIIGALFGSFYTLATYRIPKGQDITHTRSYCPNCDHRLGFFDMFPILSYILLGGKCKYCKKKISPRYILFEIFSGFVFVVIFHSMKIDIKNIYAMGISCIFNLLIIPLYISYLFITIGIDKENRKIDKNVTIFGIIISLIYMAYLCIVENANIYRYAIYIVFYILVLILDTIALKKYATSLYLYGISAMLITMAVFSGEIATLFAIVISLVLLGCKILYNKIKMNKKDKSLLSNINYAYFLGIANFISFIAINYIKNYGLLNY